jgi:phosphodiesterase/alkaline phosphatase D-like protein
MAVAEAVAIGSEPLWDEGIWEELLAYIEEERVIPIVGPASSTIVPVSLAVLRPVWLTADVHYCAAHYYNPRKASFRDFDPFWEFVAGPLNAGTFGPNALDGTYGPQVVFFKAPPPGQSNLSPFSGLQFFGEVNIDAQTTEMTVDLRDINGMSVFRKLLQPRMF